MMIGVMGGFTTFSAFGHETLLMIEKGSFGFAMLNITANVLLSLFAVAGGRYIVNALA